MKEKKHFPINIGEWDMNSNIIFDHSKNKYLNDLKTFERKNQNIMDREFFEEITKIAPNLMQFICKAYGYFEHNGEYFSNYLIDATKPKQSRVIRHIRVKDLQEHFDANLEPFKMNVFLIIAHLEANSYIFQIFADKTGGYDSIFVTKENFYIDKYVEKDKCISIEYMLQKGALIAANYLENNG